MYFPKWFKNGISIMSDNIDEEGIFLSQHDINKKYPNLKYNFLEYYRLRKVVTSFVEHN